MGGFGWGGPKSLCAKKCMCFFSDTPLFANYGHCARVSTCAKIGCDSAFLTDLSRKNFSQPCKVCDTKGVFTLIR